MGDGPEPVKCLAKARGLVFKAGKLRNPPDFRLRVSLAHKYQNVRMVAVSRKLYFLRGLRLIIYQAKEGFRTADPKDSRTAPKNTGGTSHHFRSSPLRLRRVHEIYRGHAAE